MTLLWIVGIAGFFAGVLSVFGAVAAIIAYDIWKARHRRKP